MMFLNDAVCYGKKYLFKQLKGLLSMYCIMSDTGMTEQTETSSTMVDGRVKWFNNMRGYGFITVTSEGDHKDEDIFVHHSAIDVSKEQYKYLVQGEYVQFLLSETSGENDDHKWHALSVKGPSGGDLMCETRMHSRAQRTEDSTNRPQRRTNQNGGKGGQRQGNARYGGRGPRQNQGDGDDDVEYILVKKKVRGANRDRRSD